MDESTSALATVIGSRVRQERNARRWTLDRLAHLAGVSRRMVVNVEQGAANPSVGTLLRISDALGIRLPVLVEPPDRSSVLTRRGEGSVLWRGALGGEGTLVSHTQSPDVLELWDWTLAPGDAHESEAHQTGTRELLQVLNGAVHVTVDKQLFILELGDALTFAGDLPHRYSNLGEIPARFSLTVYEPNVGTKTGGGPHGRL